MSINSKYISYLLRHDKRIGNIVDDYGFISLVDLNEIINNDKHCFLTEQQLIKIIDDPETKKRFEYEFRPNDSGGNTLYARALNGHSFSLRANIFERWSPSIQSKYIYHVTNHRSVDQILKEGLKPMGRQYIHLYMDKNLVKYDGKRNTLLEIGPLNPNQQELELFSSKNGYLMCPHVIPSKFIKPILDK